MLANTLFTVDEFISRRQAFAEKMPENSVAFIHSGKELTRSNDTEYSFCPNKHFYYLTGFHEPDALLMLIKDKGYQSVLFCRDKDPEMEVWHGRRVGPQNAKVNYGFDECLVNQNIDDEVIARLSDKSAVMCNFAEQGLFGQVNAWISEAAKGIRVGKKPPTTILDCQPILAELRLIKTKAELEVMRRVNIISGGAHQRAMAKTRAGLFEYQIEAELLHEFMRHGARHPAYSSIVASGDNANILHYTDNQDILQDGHLLLIDAGGELAGYAADITRTFPVNGSFSAEQKAIYELVLKAQIAAIEAIKPRVTFAQLNELVCNILTEGLYQLGILTGNLTTLVKEKACKAFFIHGLGHWLGLDVHDVGDYQANAKREQLRPFEAGMVLTIEPGLYIPLGADVHKKWQGIGVRIEDNILVTDTGYENLTVNAPKTIEEIEAIMHDDKGLSL